MSQFLETVQTVPVRVDDDGDDLPRITSYNGDNPRQRAPGFFYVKEPGMALPAPWKPSQKFANETGYEATGLHLAIIGSRMTPFKVLEHGAQKQRVFLERWEPGARFYTEILCFVQEETGPRLVIWAAKGLTGKRVVDRQ